MSTPSDTPFVSREQRLARALNSSLEAVHVAISNSDEEEVAESYDDLMPLLMDTLRELPDEEKSEENRELFSLVLQSVSTLAQIGGKEEFAAQSNEVVDASLPWLAALPPHDSAPSVLESQALLLESAAQLSDVMETDCTRLLEALRDAFLHSLCCRIDDDLLSERSKLIMDAREKSCEFITQWAPINGGVFVERAEEISNALADSLVIRDTHEARRLYSQATKSLCALLTAVKQRPSGDGLVVARALWSDHWEKLQREECEAAQLEMAALCWKALGPEAVTVDAEKEIAMAIRRVLERKVDTPGMLNDADFRAINWASYFLAVTLIARPSVTPSAYNLLLVWKLPQCIHQKRHQVALDCQSSIVSLLVSSLSDANPAVRCDAALAFTTMGKSARLEWKQLAVGFIEILEETIDRADARTDEWNLASEGAIGSVVAILKNCKESIGPVKYQRTVSKLLQWLPLTTAGTEAVAVYSFLADLIEHQRMTLMGETEGTTSKLLAILVRAIHLNLFDAHSKNRRVKEKLKKVIREASEVECFDEWIKRAQLSEAEERTLSRILA